MARFFKLFLIISVLVIGIFFIFSSRHFLGVDISTTRNAIKNFFAENTDKRKIIELQAEIERLKIDTNFSRTGTEKDRYLYKIAEVYSRYPFNDQSSVVISLGSEDGIREGMPVFLERGVLFGKVRSVKRTQSEVETIFNATWKTSVAIGTSGIRAVYIGGTVPLLDLIPKEAPLAPGDVVFNISPDIPLHTILGTISEIDSSSYDVWQRAKVAPTFDQELFRSVLVMINFP